MCWHLGQRLDGGLVVTVTLWSLGLVVVLRGGIPHIGDLRPAVGQIQFETRGYPCFPFATLGNGVVIASSGRGFGGVALGCKAKKAPSICS